MVNTAPKLSAQPVTAVPFLRLPKRETRAALLFILPATVGFVVFYALPFLRGVLISLTDWDLVTAAEFVGLRNFERLAGDQRFWNALGTTFQYVVINVGVQISLALLLAVFIHRFTRSIVVRAIIIVPYLLSNVVVALLWMWMLDPRLGIVNEFLMAFGLDRQPFLGSPDQALLSVILINIWRHVGYSTLLFLAGLQTIPTEYYEAAAIDGASEVRRFRSITLPLLRPVIAFIVITGIIGSFQVFDTIAVTTGGGPSGATRVIVWYIYEYAFERFNMGYSSAIAIAVFLILIVLTVLQVRLFRAGESQL